MDVNSIVSELDAEISRLQHIRAALTGLGGNLAEKPKRGRPKGTKATKKAATSSAPAKRQRRLSPEGRKRIAEAMKRRWAERRKDASK